jgi:hypothetical protein
MNSQSTTASFMRLSFGPADERPDDEEHGGQRDHGHALGARLAEQDPEKAERQSDAPETKGHRPVFFFQRRYFSRGMAKTGTRQWAMTFSVVLPRKSRASRRTVVDMTMRSKSFVSA